MRFLKTLVIISSLLVIGILIYIHLTMENSFLKLLIALIKEIISC